MDLCLRLIPVGNDVFNIALVDQYITCMKRGAVFSGIDGDNAVKDGQI